MRTKHCRWIGYGLVLFIAMMWVLVSVPAPISAANTNNSIENRPFPTESINNQDTPKDAPSVGWTVFKLILSLLAIIALTYLIIRVFGKQVNRKFRGRWLQVLDELIIGPNRGVVLCEIGGRILALGVTDHNINVLFEVSDEHLIKEMLAAGAPQEMEEWSQLTVIKGLVDRIKKPRSDQFGNTLDQWLDETKKNTKERGNDQ